MAGAFQVGVVVSATLAFTDPDGTAGKPVGVPAWSFDNPAVWAPTVSADGLSASGPVLSVGACNVTVVAQGDPVAGTDVVTLTGQLVGQAEEISGGTITFAAASAPSTSRRS